MVQTQEVNYYESDLRRSRPVHKVVKGQQVEKVLVSFSGKGLVFVSVHTRWIIYFRVYQLRINRCYYSHKSLCHLTVLIQWVTLTLICRESPTFSRPLVL